MSQRTVFIVEDDPGIRRLLERAFEQVGLRSETFESAESFLAVDTVGRPGCVVLDAGLPGMSGLDLQAELQRRGETIPIVFLTGLADVAMVRSAMKAGCSEFLEKPVEMEELLEAVRRALQQDRLERRHAREIATIRSRIDNLTPREREVLEMVVTGKTNKQISVACGVSARTVEIHRSNVMKKMGAGSLAELVQLYMKVHPA